MRTYVVTDVALDVGWLMMRQCSVVRVVRWVFCGEWVEPDLEYLVPMTRNSDAPGCGWGEG